MKIKDEAALLTAQERIEAKDREADLVADPEVALGTQREENLEYLNQVTLAQDREEDRVDDRGEDHHAPKFHKLLDRHQHPARLHLDHLKVKTRKPLPLTEDIDCVVTDNSVTNAPHADSGDASA